MPKTVKPPVLKKPLAQTIRPARAITRTDVAAFSLATVLCIVALIIVMKLWKADPQVPFEYFAGGDAFSQAMLTKGVIDNPWYLHNKLMGAPGAQDFHDYPLTDTLHFFIMKLLGLFYPSFGFVLNAFFLLTFVLTTWTALFVFRSLHFAYPPAIVGSIVYAFLPYHLWRFQHHLLLGSYYCVPLMILATLWCMQGVILEFRDGPLFALLASHPLRHRSHRDLRRNGMRGHLLRILRVRLPAGRRACRFVSGARHPPALTTHRAPRAISYRRMEPASWRTSCPPSCLSPATAKT